MMKIKYNFKVRTLYVVVIQIKLLTLFYILENNCDSDCWIILDSEGNIRVWDRTMEELFFGKESEYVFEKNDKGEYLQVAV